MLSHCERERGERTDGGKCLEGILKTNDDRVAAWHTKPTIWCPALDWLQAAPWIGLPAAANMQVDRLLNVEPATLW